jgi:hypothetical protein
MGGLSERHRDVPVNLQNIRFASTASTTPPLRQGYKPIMRGGAGASAQRHPASASRSLCSAGIDKRLTAAQVKARLRDLKQGG